MSRLKKKRLSLVYLHCCVNSNLGLSCENYQSSSGFFKMMTTNCFVQVTEEKILDYKGIVVPKSTDKATVNINFKQF